MKSERTTASCPIPCEIDSRVSISHQVMSDSPRIKGEEPISEHPEASMRLDRFNSILYNSITCFSVVIIALTPANVLICVMLRRTLSSLNGRKVWPCTPFHAAKYSVIVHKRITNSSTWYSEQRSQQVFCLAKPIAMQPINTSTNETDRHKKSKYIRMSLLSVGILIPFWEFAMISAYWYSGTVETYTAFISDIPTKKKLHEGELYMSQQFLRAFTKFRS